MERKALTQFFREYRFRDLASFSFYHGQKNLF